MKKLLKTILSVMLAVTALFAFAACDWDGEIESPDIKGQAISYSEVETLISDIQAMDDAVDISEGWYKFTVERKATSVIGDERRVYLCRYEGKMYMSRITYDRKFKVDFEEYEYVTNTKTDEESSTIVKGKLICVDGRAYTEYTVYEEDEYGKSEIKCYETGNDSEFDTNDMYKYLETNEVFKKLFVGSDADYYKTKKGYACDVDDVGDEYTMILEFDKEDLTIKSAKEYSSKELTVSGTSLEEEYLVVIKKAASGSVKAPDLKDYEGGMA